ncbi:MAG: cytochrome c oxidase subunit 3 family protein [Candidatus Latescibacteria bacterium]|nr:cytochrome c oxidase subunit 3 family protein [Candidatus Latescibacterota bacterium]
MSTPHEGRDEHAHPHLQHHFESMAQQYDSGKFGMWLFLVTEVLLFGGLFCAYAVYRANHPEIFAYAHQFLDKTLGGLNTLVLIVSSLTMAMAVRCAQLGQQRRLKQMLAATLLCACIFLGVKGVEYEHKWKHGLLWGTHYVPQGETVAPADAAGAATTAETTAAAAAAPADGGTTLPHAATGPQGLADHSQPGHGGASHGGHGPAGPAPRNVHLFFGIYFVMTGLHGIHVLAGMIAIVWLLRRSAAGEFGPEYFAPVDFVGLYWHLVDLIWIFLFPLLYLIH